VSNTAATLSEPAPPTAVNNEISTSGTTTFTWPAYEEATGYALSVRDPNDVQVANFWMPVATYCNAATCAINANVFDGTSFGTYTLSLAIRVGQSNWTSVAPATNTALAAISIPRAAADRIQVVGDTTFTWNANADASGYTLVVRNPQGGTTQTLNATPGANCTAGVCSISANVFDGSYGTYGLELTTTLPGDDLVTPNSAATLAAPPVPQAQLNEIQDDGPTAFVWDAHPDGTGYVLEVTHNGQTNTYFTTANTACADGVCRQNRSTFLGYGDYDLTLTFQVNGTWGLLPDTTNTAQAAVSLPQAANGRINATTNTTFTWDANPDANGYVLSVFSPASSQTPTFQRFVNPATSCTGGVCSTSGLVFDGTFGTYTLDLASRDSTSNTWGVLPNATNTAETVPQPPTPSALNDTIQTTGGTVFSWPAYETATSYGFFVYDPSDTVVAQRFDGPNRLCIDGTCSTTFSNIYTTDGVYDLELLIQVNGDWTVLPAMTNTATAGSAPNMLASTADIVVDDADAGVSRQGVWTAVEGAADAYDGSYVVTTNVPDADQSFTFAATLPNTGTYEVLAWWAAADNQASLVPMTVRADGQVLGTEYVNQQSAVYSGQWVSLGTYSFEGGATASVEVSTLASPDGQGAIAADAVRFRQVP
jgi:hypothetical protein